VNPFALAILIAALLGVLLAVVVLCILSIMIVRELVSGRKEKARRGRCLTCGYDLRGDFAAGCPECGWNRKEAKA
jgi:hypothetical protein